MSDDGDFGLVDTEEADGVGDEWESIDVSDTEADEIARTRDREFSEFRKRIKNTEQFKVTASVFDDATYGALYKLVQDGHIDAFGGPISTGKEANVYTALAGDSEARSASGQSGGDGEPRDEEVAVKVYRINASDFRDMRGYLDGDPRFEGIGSDKKKVVTAWVRKEFANLQRAQKAGVRVPNPIAVQRNVLVMEYIATEDGRAKRLNEVHIENPETAFEVVREYMRRLYDAGLVHGDLSEYNIVFHEGQLVVIDLGQAVTVHHGNARDYLERDCENVANFFARQGVDVTAEDLLATVTRADEAADG
ncbi:MULTISPECIES: serine/threonine-protein kinase Rio1 [Halomicrobium]|uniref:non-specific serine/threonine protein kinase n=2 Tax=Halomicrobium mukohataei TaxID=57705 RepID=C7NZS4_HALMD|nr:MULTISPECIES: serine/threonine-protein kinase Rio1 [Halomicrobium]ACV46832.1 Non-specific serine/threonine protein kinase [Halomicrobium mukohataei DSM 12286]QCD65333.1 serine protein kinase RIO [Halomicrobium mukohataei]QFR20139.1 serine protein kinase RIO [Halomicrobium sp. ZPS1]